MNKTCVKIFIVGIMSVLIQPGNILSQSANGTAGLFDVSDAEVVAPGSFGFNITGRQHRFSEMQQNQLSISMFLGMSKYIEFGASLSDALNLLADSLEHPRFASLTMKTRIFNSEGYLPSLSTAFTIWRTFSNLEETTSQADYGLSVLLSEKVGRAKIHLNAGSILSELRNNIQSRLLFGAGLEFMIDSSIKVFLETTGKTGPFDETDLLLARYSFGLNVRVWREIRFQGQVGYDRLNDQDGYNINFGLLAGATAVRKVKPKIKMKRPTISSFSNLISLDQALKSLKKDTAATAKKQPEPEEKPKRLMDIPSSLDSLPQKADDSNIFNGIRIQAVYNACGKPYLASLLKEKLISLGGEVDKIGDGDSFNNWQTTIICHPDLRQSANRLAEWFNISSVQIEESFTGEELIINIGCDLVDLINGFGYKVIQTTDGIKIIHPEEQ